MNRGIKSQIKAGAVLSYISFGFANLIGLVYTPFMLRMMGQEEYGLYSLVASVISYLTVLDFGFGNAIVRYTSKYKAEGRERELPEMYGMFTGLYCMMGLIATVIGLLILFNVDSLFGQSMTLEELGKIRIMMCLMVFNLAFTFAMSIWRSIPVAYERFVFTNGLNLIRMLLNPIIMVVLLLLGYKAIALVILITGLNIATLLIDYLYCKRSLCVSIKFGKVPLPFLKEVFVYSFWIFLGVVVERLYWSTGQFVLGMYVGSAAVGIFAVAVQLAVFFSGIGSAIPSVLLPRMTKISFSENSERITSDFFINVTRIQYVILLLAVILFAVFGRDFVVLWAGDGYQDVFIMAWLFMVVQLLPCAEAAGPIVAQARNEVRPYALIRLISSAAGLVLSMFLSKLYGYFGCTIGISSALLVQTVILNIYYVKYLHLDIARLAKEIFTISWAPVLVGLIGYFLFHNNSIPNLWLLVFKGAVFGLLLIIVCWFLSLNDYERDLISRPLKRLLNINCSVNPEE